MSKPCDYGNLRTLRWLASRLRSSLRFIPQHLKGDRETTLPHTLGCVEML
jgi:hypothetical protein